MAKEKRRQYGSGSVYQRTDGRWVGAIMAGWTSDGKRRRITMTGKTEAEVKRAIERKRAEIAREGTPPEGVSARATVKSWSDRWLEMIVHRVRPKTYGAHRGAVRNAIVPAIGHRRLDQLTLADIRAVGEYVRSNDQTQSTAVRARAVLGKMLRDAAKEGHAVPPRVYLEKGEAPSKSSRGPIPLSDVHALLKVAAGSPDGSRWFMALHTGARQGECIGLTWDRVDLAKGTVDLSWQLQRIPYVSGRSGPLRIPDGYEHQQIDGGMCLVRPKSQRSIRVIPMTDALLTQMKLWRSATAGDGLVWHQGDGRPLTDKDDRTEWYSLQARAGVKRTDGSRYQLHEARHAAASVMLENGVSPEVIQAVLGHNQVVTTMRYAHVSRELSGDAIRRLGSALELPG